MDFITRATPINDIDGKSHKMELKSSFKVKITPLAINSFSGVHTQTHACIPAMKVISRNQAVPGLKIARILENLNIMELATKKRVGQGKCIK